MTMTKRTRIRKKGKIGDLGPLKVPLSSSTHLIVVPLLLCLIVFVNGSIMVDLCHPSCDCLDTYFDCSKRGLSEFPSDLPSWIQKLNISLNSILDVDLTLLRNIEAVALDSNNLTDIPTTSLDLNHLTYLSLSGNQLTTLSASNLVHFTTLHVLDLSKNQIQIISNTSFPTNSSLRRLNLAHNEIHSLEEGCFKQLLHLDELILSRNKLKALPIGVFSKSLLNLEKLDLSRNRLEVLDSLRFQELGRLLSLNLRRNGIRNLSDAAFYGLDKLQQLHLDGNRIGLIERRWLYGLRSLRTLNLSGNSIVRLEDNCWEAMDELYWLDLSFNNLTWLSKKSVDGLSRLRHLDLSNNAIFDLRPDTFTPLGSLENLDLSINAISWLVEDTSSPFKGLDSCKTLNLAGNRIQTLHPDALLGLSSLRTLNMSSNPLRWLQPETFVPFPSLSILVANVSTFICDCHSTWLHSRLSSFAHFPSSTNSQKHGRGRHRDRDKERNSSSNRSTVKNSPQCVYPSSLESRFLTDLSLQELSCPGQATPRALFIQQPDSTTFLKDGNGSLACIAQSSVEAPSVIHWVKDHLSLPPHLQPGVSNFESISEGQVELTSSLFFTNVSWADAGRYQCVAQNTFGITYSSKATITVHIFPHFAKKPANVTVRLGANAKLECGAKGFPVPEIAFQKDGGENFPAALQRRFHVMPSDDSFMILDLQLADMGSYCCFARNAAGEVKACASVTVYETPRFKTGMRDERVVEGSSTILECNANGWPPPQIAWSKDNLLLTSLGDDEDATAETSHLQLKENGSLLIIRDVKLEDGGTYECILSNAVGTARDFLSLTVFPASDSTSMLQWSSPVMLVAMFIVVVCFIVAVALLYFVLVFRKNSRIPPDRNNVPHHYPLSTNDTEPDDHKGLFGGDSPSDYPSVTNPNLNLFPGVAVVLETGSGSSKDSGTGEDIPLELDPGVFEQEALMMGIRRGSARSDAFSTFGGPGGGHGGAFRVEPGHHQGHSHNSSLGGEGDVLLCGVNPRGGKGFFTMPRKVPMPIPPPSFASVNKEEGTVNYNIKVEDKLDACARNGCSGCEKCKRLSPDESWGVNNDTEEDNPSLISAPEDGNGSDCVEEESLITTTNTPVTTIISNQQNESPVEEVNSLKCSSSKNYSNRVIPRPSTTSSALNSYSVSTEV